ncbi:MAG: Ni/Fe-hydrogenase cytochrome b subunit [Phycisphaeraceae bacterium]
MDGLSRREFLRCAGSLTATGAACALAGPAQASATSGAAGHGGPADPMGVLVDMTQCIGCRRCEQACKKSNGFDPGPDEAYEDPAIFAQMRRPAPDAYTVVNAWPNRHDAERPVYAKINCMHCNHPACVSACIVGALNKQDDGAVTYDAWKCIGCRYCMVACPFQVPTYEYDNVLTPQVRKCTFCLSRTSEGQRPACVEACPRDALLFGKRNDLLQVAHQRISQHPTQYIDHVYGEHEVGGTSWIYLSCVPFEEAGFLKLGSEAPPVLTEAIQHGVFKYWLAPVGLYGFLATMMWHTGRRAKVARQPSGNEKLELSRPSSPPATRMAGLAGNGGGAAMATLTHEMAPIAPSRQPQASAATEAPRLLAHPHPASQSLGHPLPGGEGHAAAAPVAAKLLTPGTWFLLALVAAGVLALARRFIFGLGATTNLDQQHPWGLWIAMDVGSGIALAGGGFVTAALVHIFHREHYHAVARSALLTALLGYTFYVPGLLADIGRWYNIWHPTIPTMWQGNSVLFEVGLCVMIYLNVQYAELAPIICERFMGERNRWPRLAHWAGFAHKWFERGLPALLVLGVTLSAFHQSSLGNLMVIAPYKLHMLWWSPVSPLLFLLSAMMVGFPMVIFTILFASWSLKRKPEMHVLAPLSRYIVVFLALYLAVKVGDMAWRGTYSYLFDGSLQSVAWIAEVALGVVLPLVLLSRGTVRRSERWLAASCLMVILGVVLNRLNVFVIGYSPPFATRSYFPSLTEFALSIGLVAALLLAYRLAVTYLPILEPEHGERARA